MAPELALRAPSASLVSVLLLLALHGYLSDAQGQDALPNSFEAQLAAQEAELLPDSPGTSSAGSSGENRTAYDVVLSRPDLSILRLAINMTDTQPLYETVEGEPTTYLLPNNEAFRDLLRDQTKENIAQQGNDTDFYLLERLFGDPALRIVLSFNIFPLQVWTEERIMQGQSLVSGYGLFKVDITEASQAGNDTLAGPAFVDGYDPSLSAQIVEADIELLGLSVAHIINKVLRPPYILPDPSTHKPSPSPPNHDDGKEHKPGPSKPEKPEHPEMPEEPEEPKEPEEPQKPEDPQPPKQPEEPEEPTVPNPPNPSPVPEQPEEPEEPTDPNPPNPSPVPERPEQPCGDVPPSQQFTCEQQKTWGKCHAIWMVKGGYCRATCGTCVPGEPAPEQPTDPKPPHEPSPVPEQPEQPCDDVPPSQQFTCEQQKAWGKCHAIWLVKGGYCRATCGRCAPADPTPEPPGFTTIKDVGPASVSADGTRRRLLSRLPVGDASLSAPGSASGMHASEADTAAAKAPAAAAAAAAGEPASSDAAPTGGDADAHDKESRDLREVRNPYSSGFARMPVGGRARFAATGAGQGAGAGLKQKLGSRVRPSAGQPVAAVKPRVMQSRRLGATRRQA